MKTIPSIIFLLFTSAQLWAQNFTGSYVDHSDQVIACTFEIAVDHFNPNKILPNTFRKGITLIDSTGRKFFKPNHIKSFEINRKDEGQLKFVTIELQRNKYFVEQVEEGVIGLYKNYFIHAFDGAVTYQYIIDIKGKDFLILSRNNFKKKILDYLKNEKFFRKKLKKRVRYKDLQGIVSEFNSRFK